MPLATLCGCTARFVWDLVGYPEDRFSHNEAQIVIDYSFNRHMNLSSFKGNIHLGHRASVLYNASDSGSRGWGIEAHSGQTLLCP